MFIQPIQVLQANNNTESNRMTNVETKNGLFLLLLRIVAGRGREREMKDCQIKNGSFFIFIVSFGKSRNISLHYKGSFVQKTIFYQTFNLRKI